MASNGALYDYGHQAWTYDGRYMKCGHLIEGIDKLERAGDVFTNTCNCYGRAHEGEEVQVHLGGSCVLRDGVHVLTDCLARGE